MSQWTATLNNEQKDAVLHTEGPLLILAGAGSGKTTVLVSRTGNIISKGLANPDQILVLTFTNKAAKELKERVSKKLNLGKKKIWAGTFHGFGLEFLKKNHRLADLPQRFGLLDATDSRFLIKEIMADKRHDSKAGFDLEKLQNLMGSIRAGKTISPDIPEEYQEMAHWLLPNYISRMHSLGSVDFDGLLLKPIELLEENENLSLKYKNKFKYIMVDEFQDTNNIQMKLIMALCNHKKNLAVVGDDDQSIYGWRGAEIKNILNFPRLFSDCEVVRLETNYRSTPEIIELANAVISENEERHEKKLLPQEKVQAGSLPELLVYDNEEVECEEISNLIAKYLRAGTKATDIAVLFRSNSQGALLEGYLRQARISYEMTGGPALIDRKEVRDVLSYLRAAFFPNDISLRRVLNVPARGIGDTSVHKIIDYQKENNIDFIKALKLWRLAEVNPKTGESIQGFFELLKVIKEKVLNTNKKYADLLPEIFSEIGYKAYVFGAYKDGATAKRKWQLVEILGRILDGFVKTNPKILVALKDFIDALSLREVDLNEDKTEAKVQLLTFHASKGLEYPVVILMGVDEGLIPHETLGHNISEERRLFYVGVTRAQQELIMTRAKIRQRYGRKRETFATRFLSSVPENLYNVYEGGLKPVTEEQRVDMLADLYKKLNKSIEEDESL